MIDQALILAAGRGSRLAGKHSDPESFSKPLLEVAGQTLLGHALASCAAAGLQRAVVVTGYQAEQVSDEVARCNVIEGISVRNDRWEEPNGVSVLAARDFLDGDFFLLMADHLFESSILVDLAAAGKAADVILAVDPRIDSILDLDDATKVLLSGQSIVDIGKAIPEYDAVDCGLFYCTQELFHALDRAEKRAPPSLTDGLLEILCTGSFNAMEIGDRWWQDVDTVEMAAAATNLFARRPELLP